MKIYERINDILHEKRISKKEFAEILTALEPKVNRISEVPSIQSVYTYLSGRNTIKADLIPYIAEALDISEQELFPDTAKNRLNYLRYILKNPTISELKIINNEEKEITLNIEAEELISLLPYIPSVMLKSFIQKAKDIKKITLESS